MSELRTDDGTGRHRSNGRAGWGAYLRPKRLLTLTTKQKVLFGRIRAAIWIAVGLASFPLGWANSVVLVWIASFYANAESGFATAEGADDRDITAKLAHLQGQSDMQIQQLSRIENLLNERMPATSN